MSFQFDGKKELLNVARKAGYKDVSQLVASFTLFTHPETVSKTKNKNLFNIVRDSPNRGKIIEIEGRKVMACDNTGPQHAFLWSNGNFKYDHVQFNHIYSESKNVEIYTSLANICLTPSFIAKLTDKDETTKNLLRYRAYDLYGFNPLDKKLDKPDGYEALNWKSMIDPLDDLKGFLKERIERCPLSRTAISCRELGWMFSGD